MTNRWIQELPLQLRHRIPGDLPPLLPAAPEDAVQAVRAGDNGDPLVPIQPDVPAWQCYDQLPLPALPRVPQLRRDVVRRLHHAGRRLPEGITLYVLDGWRTSAFQSELLAYYREQEGGDLGLYVSDPHSSTLMPPHVTGGAVDLTLAVDGIPVAMGTDFDSFDDAAHLLALENVPDGGDPRQVLDRDLRRLLGHVLMAAGFGPYPLEWWHWSHGDQRWAAFVGEDETLYSPIEG